MRNMFCRREVSHKTDNLDCGANYVPSERPKDDGSVVFTSCSPENGRGNNSKCGRWGVQVDSHRGHHQQHTKDHHLSTSSTQATSTRAVHSNTGRVGHDFGKVSEARSADRTRRECEAGRPLRTASEWDMPSQHSEMTAGDAVSDRPSL